MKHIQQRLLPYILLQLFLLLMLAPPILAQDETATPEPVRPPAPFPATSYSESGIVLEFYFEEIKQGGVGLAKIVGENIVGARAILLNKQIDFFQIPDDGWYGLLVANMDVHPRDYNLSLLIETEDEDTTSFQIPITVSSAGFIRQDFNVPSDRAHLIDPEVERHEFARLEAITATFTPERLWTNAGFDLPIDAEITSSFGSFRVLNNTVQTRHTGWDQKAPVGTPVTAIAAGRVAFAGQLDIRGNYVMIDHGFGIYSGYAHFSQVHVTRGQSITRGQIIGMSGNEGRSSGPHLHWEINVNGEWIDNLDFVEMWLP